MKRPGRTRTVRATERVTGRTAEVDVRRYKKDEGAPNKLHDEVEPNKLSWTSADGANADPGELPDFEEELTNTLSDQDGDDGEPDTRTDAERAVDLQAELDREARSSG